jgi:hypothetical protein
LQPSAAAMRGVTPPWDLASSIAPFSSNTVTHSVCPL